MKRYRNIGVTAVVFALAAAEAHAQLVGGGGGGGGYFSGIIQWVVQNIIQGLIFIAVLVVGATLLMGRHSMAAIGVAIIGAIVITHYSEIATAIGTVGGGLFGGIPT